MKRRTNTQTLLKALRQPVIQQQQLDSLFRIKPSHRTTKSVFVKTGILIIVVIGASACLWTKYLVMVPV